VTTLTYDPPMAGASTNLLADDQLVAFDTEYVDDVRWKPIAIGLDELPSDISFLDIGGGNGVFVDRVLEAYPSASGIVGDNAAMLLDLHAQRAGKTTIRLDALALPDAALERVDVVFLNWVLHHLVETGDYETTRRNIVRVLADVRWLLKPGGRLSVYENMYDGSVLHNAPSHLIFGATSSRRLARVTRRFGANTAGVGVCFQSEASWRKIFDEAGFEVVSFTPDEVWPMSTVKRLGLMIRSVRCGQFWLAPRGQRPR
jgi:SAM-dependent methyltransferase